MKKKSHKYIGKAEQDKLAAQAVGYIKTHGPKTPSEPEPPFTRGDITRCVELLGSFAIDVLPQIGKLAIQDYAGLNEGLILYERITNYTKARRRE